MRFSALSICMFLMVSVFAMNGCVRQGSIGASLAALSNEDRLPPDERLEPDTALLWVRGMGCPQCANNVDAQLMKVEGVESVKIDMGSGKVTVSLTPGKHPTRDQLANAIDQTGFTLVKVQMPKD
ncbi:MAG: heavy-metal-associated domain-containing protein [Phycisphaerales bacterium]|nr:heavy-metal-associated domain-containing protein [Phycisphaerales bacterium]MCI0630997.1 heavy-metal-associated domain-containing protein [Phycisphaerales bacterium]MCI0676490.1 heavy-metal-associated domain-containing protein [Phycisphaerales bacterium]